MRQSSRCVRTIRPDFAIQLQIRMLKKPGAIIITRAKPSPTSMAPPRRTELWDVQRLLILAAKKESPATCPMARVPADELAVLGSMISDFLRVPSDMHLHPPATMACKVCFTPVCETCEENGVNCRCGVNDLRSSP